MKGFFGGDVEKFVVEKAGVAEEDAVGSYEGVFGFAGGVMEVGDGEARGRDLFSKYLFA